MHRIYVILLIVMIVSSGATVENASCIMGGGWIDLHYTKCYSFYVQSIMSI